MEEIEFDNRVKLQKTGGGRWVGVREACVSYRKVSAWIFVHICVPTS